MPILQSELLRKASSYQALNERMQKTASAVRRKNAFLCHSHRDEILIKGLLALFLEVGIDLYIDWKDHSMPDTPNAETARRIQEKIRTSEMFIFFATANSKASRWCPWEIGYADSSQKRIYVVPTSDGRDTFGNEYLELYERIDVGTDKASGRSGYAVFSPRSTNGAWLSRQALKY